MRRNLADASRAATFSPSFSVAHTHIHDPKCMCADGRAGVRLSECSIAAFFCQIPLQSILREFSVQLSLSFFFVSFSLSLSISRAHTISHSLETPNPPPYVPSSTPLFHACLPVLSSETLDGPHQHHRDSWGFVCGYDYQIFDTFLSTPPHPSLLCPRTHLARPTDQAYTMSDKCHRTGKAIYPYVPRMTTLFSSLVPQCFRKARTASRHQLTIAHWSL